MDRPDSAGWTSPTLSTHQGWDSRSSVACLRHAQRRLHGSQPINTFDTEDDLNFLLLYPSWWRARYEEEMQAVLDEHDVTLRTRIDLLRGALDAWISIGRSDMTTVNQRGNRSWMVVVPTLFVIAHFIAETFGHDSLAALLAWGDALSWFAICVATGVWAAGAGATLRQAAVRGLVTGVVAWALAWVVAESLFLLGLAGLDSWAWSLGGGHMYVAIDAGTELRWLLTPANLRYPLVLALASSSVGASVAVLALKGRMWLQQFEIAITLTRRSPSSPG